MTNSDDDEDLPTFDEYLLNKMNALPEYDRPTYCPFCQRDFRTRREHFDYLLVRLNNQLQKTGNAEWIVAAMNSSNTLVDLTDHLEPLFGIKTKE